VQPLRRQRIHDLSRDRINEPYAALREYVAYYNTHRPHRSLDQQPPLPKIGPVPPLHHEWRVRRRDRLGGLLHEYELAA
jgi:putative transposase